MLKEELINLLIIYNKNKGFCRRLFGDTDGIKDLQEFVKNRLNKKHLSYQLNENEIEELITILKNRYHRVLNKRDYRTHKTKLTNVIYKELAYLIANDNPKILALVQAYKNDYTNSGARLIDHGDDIFVMSSNYAFPISEIAAHIQLTESFSHPIPGKSCNETIPLTADDIRGLTDIPAINANLTCIQRKFSQYKNTETFTADPLYYFPKSRLFVTEDNYCFLIEEIIKILNEQNKFYNPHTGNPLAENDIKKLLNVPDVKNASESIKLKQLYCAAKISQQTINQLILLAEGFLVTHKFDIHQRAYGIFNEYYQTLGSEEKDALNDYRIEGWQSIGVASGTVSGMGSIKFKALYESFEASCTFGGSIVKMILQLNPQSNFNVSCPDGRQIIARMRLRMKCNSSNVGSNVANSANVNRSVRMSVV